MEYHVSKKGNDYNNGSEQAPFLTISKAAQIADECDRIIVHEGEYRECVVPKNGARTAQGRITYEAASGEKAVIKGSEQINNWEDVGNGVWKVVISDDFFGEYNPYKEVIFGDWFVEPIEKKLHTGQVYINGVALKEVNETEDVCAGKMTWCCDSDNEKTTIYANFAELNPKNELVEINVRKSCFTTENENINYITVRGFEMSHVASKWAPPTAEQTGMLCANWCKGWIIENNTLHDARCSAICIGKGKVAGDNLHTRYHRKPGYQHQLETVFTALHVGWSKERVGSHVVRNNLIYDCGQNGIVGHLGGAFSEIYGNHIYNIGNKHDFFGHEIAGIKLHAAIDTYIHDNNIHDCMWGTWLDWQAQGVRVSANLYFNNENDIWIEVTHGPHMVDNNIFASKMSLKNAAQGGAYVHNLFCGAQYRYNVIDRSTPYHLNHSTEVMGTALVYGSDDRYYNNIFIGGEEDDKWKCGTVLYNGYPASLEEYVEESIRNHHDPDKQAMLKQPAYINNNCYMAGAKSFEREENKVETDYQPNAAVVEDNGRFYLEIDIPVEAMVKCPEYIETKNIPVPRITESQYENADGTELLIDRDFFGNVRAKHPMVGPFEKLVAGKQRILLWDKK